ncbi:DUF2933 domain-containing protein [Acaryochloris sp. CCMEE 5410]|uniref:DUF2933 domain-containing protein n=1 Tax=Acaryochloris sp. CCMEE 5410 TaxID=310037 RepID=UPI00024841B1|nr:DUF2933 domain-containing protein [Acaryochloris sp. CCMEE 5410]KAI9129943.1 DUF2933 domain-containing protein [Acaryochloris sp. CCMEE 5410]
MAKHHAIRWRSPAGIALLIFLGIITFFLVTEHLAHVIPVLPWLLLLACPFIHLFMHSGHGGHSGHSGHGGHSEHGVHGNDNKDSLEGGPR